MAEEADVNLDVANRVVELLARPTHRLTTGASPRDGVPAAHAAIAAAGNG